MEPPVPTVDSGVALPLSQLVAGSNHICVLIGTTAWCWGSDGAGQLGIVGDPGLTYRSRPAQLTQIKQSVAGLAARGSHTCARFADGTMACWGDNTFGQVGLGNNGVSPVPMTLPLENVSAIALGTADSCAVIGDQLYCWGADDQGQFGNGQLTSSTVPIPVMQLCN
jgi:alpha-tubulin suppressor-like RCC1 family protein